MVVTPAAYLLFYRRRAKTPLGGPRFTEINRKFDGHDESGESSDTEIGDDDQPNGVYYRNNRLSIEGKPAAFRPRGARDTGATTTITPLTNSDGDGEDELPSYNTIQPSVEDEGVEMADNDHLMESNPVAQGWSFSGLGGNAPDNSAADDTASDKVQVDSTDDEHGASQSRDGDVEMNFVTTGLSDTEDGLIADGHRGDSHKEVVPLVTKNYGSGLDEVTEIHVDGDKN
jgi:ubiquitin carboxyl-terminal hydrolase 4/11